MTPPPRFSTLLVLTSAALVFSSPAPVPIAKEVANKNTLRPIITPLRHEAPFVELPVGPEDGPLRQQHTAAGGYGGGYDIAAAASIPTHMHPHPFHHYVPVSSRDAPTEVLPNLIASCTDEAAAPAEAHDEGHNEDHGKEEGHNEEGHGDGKGEGEGHGQPSFPHPGGLPKPHCGGPSFLPPKGHGGEGHGDEGHGDEGHNGEGHGGENNGDKGHGGNGEGHGDEGHNGEGHGGEGHNDDGNNGGGHSGQGEDGHAPANFPPTGAAVPGAARSTTALIGGLVAALALSLY